MTRTDRPACERVRHALAAVVASEAFSRSERLRSFLSYIVENELSGKAAQLKGYTIGIDVFGRTPGFDAGNDPLVRVQAGKLRKLLEQYYETEGAGDGLRIRVPLGSYVPEYSIAEGAAPDAPSATRTASHKPQPRRSWLPAPVSSPLALFSLLPLFFLAPSVYPDATSAAIDKAQLVLSVQNKLAGLVQALPSLHILQCWPAGGECNALAHAIAGSARYHRTVHLVDSRDTPEPHALSYAIRIENRANGQGVYVRLIHEPSGATVFTRHFSREQLRSDGAIAYEAVAFVARALTATGPLYRHAMRMGVASNLMECLARADRSLPRGTAAAGATAACNLLPAALAGVSSDEAPLATVTR